MTKSVPDRLKDLGNLYLERNALYGNTYKEVGKIMITLFPNGITLKTEEDFNRFCIFARVQGKVFRYSRQFVNGGHIDSLDDTSVYAQMLQEYDEEAAKQQVIERGEKS